MSTRNVNIGEDYTRVGTCTGEDTKYIVLFLPLGTPNMESAAENCLSNSNGELLTNVVIKNKTVNFGLGGSTSFIVEGTVFDRATTSQVRNPDVETFTLTKSEDDLKLVSNQNSGDMRSVELTNWSDSHRERSASQSAR
jgi:hypothetical protein